MSDDGVRDALRRQAKGEDWERWVEQLATWLGWRVAHFRAVRVQRRDGSTHYQVPVAGGAKGFPDFVMLKGARVLVVECKSGSGRVTKDQRGWLDAFREAGCEVYVWRPPDSDEVEAVLKGETT